MPKVDHPNIGDVLEHVYLTATLTGVDGSDDTVNFTGIAPCPNGEDIPLFYHCEPDSELRDNGALTGASGAFRTNDRVIVQCKILSVGNYEPVRVVGFRDIKPRSCFLNIQILTHKVIHFPPEIDSTAFNVTPQTDCSIQLNEDERMLKALIGDKYARLLNLSQCKYYYEGVEEGEEVTRSASLYHFDNIWLEGGYDRIVRVIGHNNVPGFEFRIEIPIPPGGIVDLVGALSEDLTKLYISLYSCTGYEPPIERQIHYFVYDLTDVGNGIKEWILIKDGKTPKGKIYVDNVLTRDGKCGCWQEAVIAGDREIFNIDTKSSCCGGSGGHTYKMGSMVIPRFVTFSLESESFASCSKMEAFHMSPFLKDYAVCLASFVASFDYGGSPLSLVDAICTCSLSGDCVDFQKKYESWNGGNGFKYYLSSGLETYNPVWDKFFTNYYYTLNESSEENGGSIYLANGASNLLSGYTTFLYRHVDTHEKTITFGGCSVCAPNPLPLCTHTASGTFVCWSFSPICHNDFYNDPGYIDVKERRLISPLEITLKYDAVYGWETIENAFISYDEKTDSLIRGLKYWTYDAAHNKHWQWKILAKFPDCEERDITDELESLLCTEHYDNIEAIIFI